MDRNGLFEQARLQLHERFGHKSKDKDNRMFGSKSHRLGTIRGHQKDKIRRMQTLQAQSHKLFSSRGFCKIT